MWQKIEQINNILRQQGKSIIQVKDVGRKQYGYIPQAVFDAVNQVIGPENWKYAVLDIEPTENQVIASVEVLIRFGDDEWLSRGPQFGSCNIVKGNLGDAKKGAITDAIQKCFSLWSIGSDAYAGKLQEIWEKGEPKDPQGQSKSQPKLEGVVFENKDGRILAKGKTYGKSAVLKASGFQWNAEEKVWWKKAA